MNVFKGTFAANTSTGNQTISGIGFTPKAIILWTSYRTATGFTDGYQFQIGMADGTNQNSWAVISNEAAPNDTDRAKSESQLILIRNVAGTNIRVATIVSLGSGEFVINWSTVDANAVVFHFMAFGGDEINVVVGNDTFAARYSASNTDFDGLTFNPELVFFVGCVSSSDAANGPCLGWAASGVPGGTITQGSAAGQVRDAQSTSITGRFQSASRCVDIFSSSAQSLAVDLRFTGGWTVAATTPTAATTAAHYLAIGGISAKAGSGNQPTSTGNQAITGLDFTPKGVMVLSVGNTTSASVATESRFSVGGSDGSNQGWAWTGAVDNVNPIRTAIGHSVSNIVTMSTPDATGSASTTEAQASLSSLDADGFTLNWGTADATQREYLWVAMGDAPVDSGGGGETSHTFA